MTGFAAMPGQWPSRSSLRETAQAFALRHAGYGREMTRGRISEAPEALLPNGDRGGLAIPNSVAGAHVSSRARRESASEESRRPD
jgi:hypothetical protein